MFVRKAALRPVPAFAVVKDEHLHVVEDALDEDDLQNVLDRAYAEIDRRQPHLGAWLSDQLATTQDELVQSLGYFLIVAVYLGFREAFPTRLREADEDVLGMAKATFSADEELRANDPTEILDSDDIVGMAQPAVVSFIQHHLEEALDQSDGDVNLNELERVYRTVLIQVVALSHAVASPSGQLGPSRDALA